MKLVSWTIGPPCFRQSASVKIAGLVSIAWLLLACAEGQGGFTEPDATAHPTRHVAVTITNEHSDNVYILLTSQDPELTIHDQQRALTIHAPCAVDCAQDCSCEVCPTPAARVRRLGAGASLVFFWDAVRFEKRSCANADGCYCYERWPLTVGSYSVTAQGFTDAEGGVPDPSMPDVLLNARPAPSSKDCSGETSLRIKRGWSQELDLRLKCE